MALATFPDLALAEYPGDDETEPNTSTQTARSGSKYTIDWQGSTQRWNGLVYRCIGSEATTLRDFYDARRGCWDPFNWTDPDGVVRKVQFVGPLRRKMISPTIWDCTVGLETVP